MNFAAFTGRLTHDPELKTATNGKPVCSFTIAVKRPHTSDTTDFFTCVAWERNAEFVAHYFKKGQRIEVSGSFTSRSYEKNGEKRKAYELKCDFVAFGEDKKTSDNEDTTQTSIPTGTPDEFTELPADDSDLPF